MPYYVCSDFVWTAGGNVESSTSCDDDVADVLVVELGGPGGQSRDNDRHMALRIPANPSAFF